MTNGGRYVLVLRLRATSPGRSCFFILVAYDSPFVEEDESAAVEGGPVGEREWRSRFNLPPAQGSVTWEGCGRDDDEERVRWLEPITVWSRGYDVTWEELFLHLDDLQLSIRRGG